MRISDWSSDVCSSDLSKLRAGAEFRACGAGSAGERRRNRAQPTGALGNIARGAADRERRLDGRSSMTATHRLKGVGWFLACVIGALGFYLLSLQVATERTKLEDMSREITPDRTSAALGSRASERISPGG